MKRMVKFGIVIAAGVACAAVLYGAYRVGGHYLVARSAADAVVADCSGKQGTQHIVTIKDNSMNPTHTHAKLCDTLTIVNADNVRRLIAFGPHEKHVPYDGVAERFLNHGQTLTITLDQTGTYGFHDHLHDEVAGDFTVAKSIE